MADSVVTRYDVAVVGAGFAGLSAAARLAREGARVIVLESRSRLGGRATAFDDRATGERVDNGQHVLLGCYTEALGFLRELGALDHVRAQTGLSVSMVDRAGRRTRLECPHLPAPIHLLAGVFEWEALEWRDRLSILRMARPLAASDTESVQSWLIRNGQTPRLLEMLWEPLALAALNQPAEHAAAPVFERVLKEMFGTDANRAAIVLPTKPLDEMYAEPARAYLEHRRGAVRTGAAARINLENGRAKWVETGADRWSVSAVISATPWFAMRDAFIGETSPIEPLLAGASGMASSPILTVNLWFDRPVIDEPFIGLPGREMQWVFDKSLAWGGAASHVTLVSSGASPLMERVNTDLIALAQDELAGALPAARDAMLLRGSVIREPRATFSLAPGQPARPGTLTPVEGLYLAGDWIDTGLPATIESAVRSGHRAADAALDMVRP